MWNWRGNRTGWHVYWSPDDLAGGQAQGSGTGASSAGTQNTEHMIPKSRFDEVNNALNELKVQLQQQQADATLREQERLKEEGRWKELAETRGTELAQVKPFQERATLLEKRMADANKARIERVPEDLRALIPTKLSTEDLADWLDANWERLTVKPAPNLDGGAGGGSGAAIIVTDADRQAAAAASASGYPTKPEDIAKRRAGKTKVNAKDT